MYYIISTGMKLFKTVIFSLIVFFILPMITRHAYAVTYDLIAPQGELKAGDQIQFTIYIDTEGSTVTSGQIGATYDAQYLQYLSTTTGAAMTSVTATPQGTKDLLLNGANSSGFTGKNVFAYLNFKITATSPGSAQLCALWGPTPTLNPTYPATTTATSQSAPIPTTLPQTGNTKAKDYASVLGGFFLVSAATFFIIRRSI